jgi:hypothetical protein
MRRARDEYFRDNKFGADGGYGDRWVKVKVGPVPVIFPNLPARRRAVKIHDMHHILTGYQTDNVGEWEISAWEVGSGCSGYLAAWFLDLTGMGAGLLFCPRRTLRAFVRGRHSGNLYEQDIDSILDWSVTQARAETRVAPDGGLATAADRRAYVAFTLLGLVVGSIWLIPPLLIVLAITWALS